MVVIKAFKKSHSVDVRLESIFVSKFKMSLCYEHIIDIQKLPIILRFVMRFKDLIRFEHRIIRLKTVRRC